MWRWWLSPPLVKVVVTVTTTFSRACIVKFFTHCSFLWKIYVQILTLFCPNLSASGSIRPLTPHQSLCPWIPLGALPPDPRFRLALHALAICLRPLSPPLFGVKLRPCEYAWNVFLLQLVCVLQHSALSCLQRFYLCFDSMQLLG